MHIHKNMQNLKQFCKLFLLKSDYPVSQAALKHSTPDPTLNPNAWERMYLDGANWTDKNGFVFY